MIDWARTSEFLHKYVAQALPLCLGLRIKFAAVDHPLYFQAETGVVLNELPKTHGIEPWIRIKTANDAARTVAQVLNFLPGPTNLPFGGPSPLAATLTGGLAGAGLGYGAGWLAEHALTESLVQRGRLRKTLALLGGSLGALPGATWGAASLYDHPEYAGQLKSLVSAWPSRPEDLTGDDPSNEFLKTQWGKNAETVTDGLRDLLAVSPYRVKAADDQEEDPTGLGAAGSLPPIQVDAFNRVVWNDYLTPASIRASTTGLTESASITRGANLITPVDVARIAVGMGSGLASGYLVGKVLGGLAGLQPEAQKKLQQAGLWAGILSNVVPLAFGQRS